MSEVMAHLDTPELGLVLGAVNTELKCVILGNVPETGVSSQTLYDSIDDYDGFAQLDVKPTAEKIGQAALNLPDVICTTYQHPEANIRFHARTAVAGRFATACAGNLLGFSYDTCTPLRTLMGEKRLTPQDDGPAKDALIDRLGLLSSMVRLGGHGRWFNRGKLQEAVGELGISGPTFRRNLKHLVEYRFVEQRREPPKKAYIRFAPGDDFSNPLTRVRQYLDLVAHFAIADKDTIETGLKRADELIHDQQRLKYLIKRSYARTGHAGKTYSKRAAV